MSKETIITFQLPLKPRVKWRRWWPLALGGGSVQEMCGKRVNRQTHVRLFGWHVLTVNRNEWHDRSDKERADEYLAKWASEEKERIKCQMMLYGERIDPETRRLVKQTMGVDFDTGLSQK